MSALDWRRLAPEPDWHECDCRFCDMGGDQEPVEWPMLFMADVDGQEYVSDRFIIVPADRAPIPGDYEGVVLKDRPNASDVLASLAGVSNQPPSPDQHFRWSVLRAIDSTGWDLRLIRGSDSRVAVIDQTGLPIGVATIARRQDDDEWSRNFTCPYGSPRIGAES